MLLLSWPVVGLAKLLTGKLKVGTTVFGAQVGPLTSSVAAAAAAAAADADDDEDEPTDAIEGAGAIGEEKFGQT